MQYIFFFWKIKQKNTFYNYYRNIFWRKKSFLIESSYFFCKITLKQCFFWKQIFTIKFFNSLQFTEKQIWKNGQFSENENYLKVLSFRIFHVWKFFSTFLFFGGGAEKEEIQQRAWHPKALILQRLNCINQNKQPD